ncbi:hypothetical protein [Aliarcobacter cryaerophilus]|uniref:hypothetical protein n=1 Tax=Aliarcobacter cryaerophilus TaxID=28198 RepID=UPI0013DD9761|nr:hypothetical protein [Aliarcobacter cryaerophilus]
MTENKENIQRILDNHSNVTQTGDIFDLKGAVIVNNKQKAKKLNKDLFEFKAHSLANYGQLFIILRNSALILLIIAFASVNYIYVPVDQEKKAFLIFFLIIGTLSAFLVLYTIAFVKVKLGNDFIEFKGKNYHFSMIRDIKYCQSIFCFGKYIKIYLRYDENNKNDKYPIRTLYLNNNDHIKLIKEFYTDYRENQIGRVKPFLFN